MYNFRLSNKLQYDYDEEYIQFDKEYGVHFVYYRINDLMIDPFIELLLTHAGDFFTPNNNTTFISPKNMDSYRLVGEFNINNLLLQCRYQGYHCVNNNIYLYYRVYGEKMYYNNSNYIVGSLYDIIYLQSHFNTQLKKNVVEYFTTYKSEFTIYNIFEKQRTYEVPTTIYTYMERSQKNLEYIYKYSSIYLMNTTSPVLELNEKRNTNHDNCVKNFVFNKNYIVSHRQVMSFLENKNIIS